MERPKRAKIGNERFKSDPRETQERPRADQSDQRAIQEMPKSGQERFKGDPRVAKNKFCNYCFRIRILYNNLHPGAAKKSQDRP